MKYRGPVTGQGGLYPSPLESFRPSRPIRSPALMELRPGSISNTNHCTNPFLARGSISLITSTSSWVPLGTLAQASGGDIPLPSHVNSFGIAVSSTQAEEVNSKGLSISVIGVVPKEPRALIAGSRPDPVSGSGAHALVIQRHMSTSRQLARRKLTEVCGLS